VTAPKLALALACALLAGCPLPQPLAEFPEGQAITPPRITGVAPAETYVRVPAGCAVQPAYALEATLFDQNALERVEARWFVDYHPDLGSRFAVQKRSDVPASDVQNDFRRTVPPWSDFRPYGYPPVPELHPGGAPPFSAAGVTHVVELVVSNGFALDGAPVALPNRTAAPGFETQSFRWVFVNVPPSAEVPCP
jgi:hypothetical protein